MKRVFLISVSFLLSFSAHSQKFDLAKTPPMGWNSWNKFACNVDENIIKGVADEVVSTGLRDAGYEYVNVDDCWHGERDGQGFISSDPVKFPSGIKVLSDYIHSKGLKFGIYSCAGTKTCAGRPGSLGHEYQDALTYAKWGVDYLKEDWCYADDVNPKGAYKLMRDALHSAGRPILLSLCEWGSNKPWLWAKDIGHSWRTTGDISNNFKSVMNIVDQNADLRQYAGPGHWNDPDMLEVGNGMSVNQDRAHFTMWCMLAAPLILGNDLRNMSQDTKDIILNKGVIALDQDPLGVQGLRFSARDSVEVWFKPLENGDWALCLLNRNKDVRKFTIQWQKYNFDDSVSGLSTRFYDTTYAIKNLWTKKVEGNTSTAKEVAISGEDVILYRLTAQRASPKKKK